jgi:hypothetical protein
VLLAISANPNGSRSAKTLLRRDERCLLQAYADAGLKRWPERPVFVYLATFRQARQAAAFFAMSERERRLGSGRCAGKGARRR